MQRALRINAILFLFAVALCFANPFSSRAARYNSEIFVSTATIYSSYRVINRVLSVAADTSVQVGIVGTSAGFKPGQILRSLLDTLDRFADLLFPLMVLAGVLSLAVGPIAALGAALAAFGIFLRIMADLITQSRVSLAPLVKRFGNACAGIGFLVALVIPLTYTIGYQVGDQITSSRWQNAIATFGVFETKVQGADEALQNATIGTLPASEGAIDGGEESALTEAPDGSETEQSDRGGFLDWAGQTRTAIGDAWGSVSDGVASVAIGARNVGNNSVQAFSSVPEYLEASSELVTAAFEYLIALIIKTLVIPILLMGVGLWLWRIMLAPKITLMRDAPENRSKLSGTLE